MAAAYTDKDYFTVSPWRPRAWHVHLEPRTELAGVGGGEHRCPLPGGIGVVETGPTFGLVSAGMPKSPAFTAVILYRAATFYLPPTVGVPGVLPPRA